MTGAGAVSRPDKVLFPEAGVTKRDLGDYLQRIAPHLLPWIADRPLVLRRFPDGVDEQGFFQKNTPDHAPESIERVEIETEDGGVTRYAVVDDITGLEHLADQAAIELHTLLTSARAPTRPIEVVFDLDPSGDEFAAAQDAARHLRTILDDLGLAPRVKSSGSRGLHVHVDVRDERADFDLTKRFAREVAELVVEQDERFTLEHRKAARGGRLFLDVLRNSSANHAIAAYSPRALPEAPIAAPLDWDEALSSRFHPRRITIGNVFRRLGQRSDPWAEPTVPSSTVADALAEINAVR